MGWGKFTSDADKVVPVIGEKSLSSTLLGRKNLDSDLLGAADMIKTLAGDTIIAFTSSSDIYVSLSGNTGVYLSGKTTISSLLGELSTKISFLGESPYSWFSIHSDTTYVTIDFTDRTCDIDDPNGDIILNGLVLYLSANNTNSYPRTGTIWYDLSTSNNDCNLSGATFKLLGKSYISFNGTDNYIYSSNLIEFDRTEPFTLCAWVNSNTVNNQQIINNQNGSYRGYNFIIHSSNVVRISHNNSATLGIGISGTTILQANTWYYLCASYDGSSSANGLNLYVNGVKELTSILNNTLGTNTTISGFNTRIGSRFPTTQGYFDGEISIVQIYNRELNESEIYHNFEKDRWRFGI